MKPVTNIIIGESRNDVNSYVVCETLVRQRWLVSMNILLQYKRQADSSVLVSLICQYLEIMFEELLRHIIPQKYSDLKVK